MKQITRSVDYTAHRFFGIADLVVALIAMECYDINEGGFGGYTLLAWATSNGHEGMVKIQLERKGVDPGRPNDFSRTPFSQAAWEGHEGVVKILLDRGDVNPDKPDDDGQTPLSYAAENGREGVVKALLGREC